MSGFIKKIEYGFLFGLGLAASVVTVFLIVQEISDFSNDDYIEYNEKSGLKVTDIHSRQTKDGVIVLGAIKNSSKNTWRYIQLEAEVYDENDVFIDECSDTVETTLKADNKENFKITCGGCSNNKITAHGKIVVKITGAIHEPDDE